MWIGISAEEHARRCKPSHEGWVTNRYPLRELGLTRADCATWLWDNYQIVVPKSACIGCLMWNIGPGRPLTSVVIVPGPVDESEQNWGRGYR